MHSWRMQGGRFECKPDGPSLGDVRTWYAWGCCAGSSSELGINLRRPLGKLESVAGPLQYVPEADTWQQCDHGSVAPAFSTTFSAEWERQ